MNLKNSLGGEVEGKVRNDAEVTSTYEWRVVQDKTTMAHPSSEDSLWFHDVPVHWRTHQSGLLIAATTTFLVLRHQQTAMITV